MSKPIKDVNDKSYHRRMVTERTVKEIICILLCIMSLLPFLILFVNATRTSEAIKAGISLIPGGNLATNWANFKAKQNGMQLTVFKAMINSFTIAVPSTIFAVYFSTMTAYGVQIYEFKLKKAAWSFIMAVMIVPNTISIIGFYRFMLKLGLLDSYIPLIIPSIAAPATVFFMRQYMQSTFSKELVEAARIDGSGEFGTFNKIAIPIMKPAIATQAIFCFVASWNNLFMPNMLLTTDAKKTLPLFVQMLRSDQFKTDYGVLYIGIAVTILPIFVVYFILSKYIVAGVALGGVKE
jgi:multiple sugar transport system permease protein